MRNRTFVVVTALTAIALITLLVLWRDGTKTIDVGSFSDVTGTAAPHLTPPPAGFSRLNEMLPGRGNLSEQATQTPVPEVPSRAAPEPAPSMEVSTTPVPGSPIKDATEGAPISEKP